MLFVFMRNIQPRIINVHWGVGGGGGTILNKDVLCKYFYFKSIMYESSFMYFGKLCIITSENNSVINFWHRF